MVLLQAHFRSEVLELTVSMNVLLPEKICPFENGKWPTLYLLHGLSDNHTIWQRHTSIERYVQDKNIAVIMPEVHRSFYTNMKHGGKYWTFISEELPRSPEGFFRCPMRGKIVLPPAFRWVDTARLSWAFACPIVMRPSPAFRARWIRCSSLRGQTRQNERPFLTMLSDPPKKSRAARTIWSPSRAA